MIRHASLPHEFSRRAVIFGAVQATGISVLMARLYYLQFIKSDDYQVLAEDNRIKLQLITPMRGRILDRKGVELATNQRNLRLLLERDNITQARDTFARLQDMVELPTELIDKLEKQLRYRHPTPMLVKQYLTWDEVAKLEFHSPRMPGMRIEEGQLRYYPLIEASAHLTGYVGKVSEEELKGQPLLRLPEFKIGKDGIERMLDQSLRGSAGSKHLEVNAAGRVLRELKYVPSVQGTDINLTIDSRLQQYAAERINNESGSVIVMEVDTGHIRALVSVPAFDPNSFSLGITHNYWSELTENEKKPLLNKAVAGQYPPGSTYKMLVGLAGLEEGVITPWKTVYCPGHFFLGKHRFNCWKASGHGHMNLVDAIAQSCDTYFYTVAKMVGMEKIAEVSRRFGLGEKTAIEMPNEKRGNIPTAEWKKKRYNQPWVGGDTINSGIGQGYVLSTPIQLAKMTAMLANGGKMVQPSLLLDKRPIIDTTLSFISSEHLAPLQEGMQKAVNDTRGTAYWKRIISEGFEMAGKTGTSQVKRITQRGMPQHLLPWKYRHHALFVGYAPMHAPRYAIAVMIEHGGGGSVAAAPVARDVMAKVQELDMLDSGQVANIKVAGA